MGHTPHINKSKSKEKNSHFKQPEPIKDGLQLPQLPSVDRKELPCFQKILNRSVTDGVPVNDIFTLQAELENLLTKNTLRSRALRKEVHVPVLNEKNKKKKGKNLKKKKDTNDKITEKYADQVQSLIHHPIPRPEAMINTGPSRKHQHPTVSGKVLPEVAQLTDIKNEATNKFWGFVDPYVSDFDSEDLEILDDMIKRYTAEDSHLYDIPPLGTLFTKKWSEEDLIEEKHSSSENCKKIRPATTGSDQENVKDILNRAEQICTSSKLGLPEVLVETIVGALVDPDLFSQDTKNNLRSIQDKEPEGPEPKRRRLYQDDEKPGVSTRHVTSNNINNNNNLIPDKHKSSCTTRNSSSTSLDSRIRRGLEDEFQLKVNSTEDQSDELLSEIHKCQDELKMIRDQNKKQFEKLRTKVFVELKRQDLKKQLDAIEEEIADLTKDYTTARRVKLDISDGRKILENREYKLSSEERSHVYSILQKRNKLLSALHEVHGKTLVKC